MDNLPVFTKNRRIAFVCFSSALGGLELSILKLASEFNKRDAECIIVVPPKTPLADYTVQNRLSSELLKPKWKYFDFITSLRLAKIFKSNRIDVAVAMQSKDISIITTAQIIHPSTKLIFFQEMQSGINKRDFFHNWMYSKLSLWFTLTKKMKQQAVENTQMPAEKIIVNPIGTDMHRFDPNLYSCDESRRRFNIPQEKFVIGMVGRLDPQKGVEELIRTVPLLLSQKTDIHIAICGEESRGESGYKQYLLNLSNSLRVNHCVQFIPFTDEAPRFLSALDIFVLPSHSETFGFVLVEAMAMGKAIVATDAGGVPEIITDGSTGSLVPPQNVPALSDAILKLIKDDDLRKSISTRARKEAFERFNIDRAINELVIAIDSI